MVFRWTIGEGGVDMDLCFELVTGLREASETTDRDFVGLGIVTGDSDGIDGPAKNTTSSASPQTPIQHHQPGLGNSQMLSSMGIPTGPTSPPVFFLTPAAPDEAAGTAPLVLLFAAATDEYPSPRPSLNMLILLIVSNGLSPLGVVGLLMSGTIPSNPPT
jgi:hypothetical protein